VLQSYFCSCAFFRVFNLIVYLINNSPLRPHLNCAISRNGTVYYKNPGGKEIEDVLCNYIILVYVDTTVVITLTKYSVHND